MKMWLDTEFDGFGGKLISIALARADGQCFYEVVDNQATQDWVCENVIPKLHKAPRPRKAIQEGLAYFLSEHSSRPEIIADWPDDLRYFCELLITGPGTRIPIPNLAMQLDLRLNSDASEIPHNALHDAIAIYHMWMRLEGVKE